MYMGLLLLHSWLRWVVLALGVATFVRAVGGLRSGRPWDAVDKRLGLAFVGSMDGQLLVGLVLYAFVSPYIPHGVDELKASMKISGLRFYAVEHPFAMLAGVVVAHVAWARSKRATTDALRFRRVATGLAWTLFLFLVGIPWPFMAHGRPLFRFG